MFRMQIRLKHPTLVLATGTGAVAIGPPGVGACAPNRSCAGRQGDWSRSVLDHHDVYGDSSPERDSAVQRFATAAVAYVVVPETKRIRWCPPTWAPIPRCRMSQAWIGPSETSCRNATLTQCRVGS